MRGVIQGRAVESRGLFVFNTHMKKLIVKESGIHNKGIFATELLPKGGRITSISGIKVKKLPKTKKDALSIPNWFGVGRAIWIDPGDSIFRYLNHSCEPNAAIIGTKTLVAMRDIKTEEEVTIDYSMTDADPLWEMQCFCNAKQCRKTIQSIQFVPIPVFKKHMPLIPRYFQRVYFRNHIQSSIRR